jgi:hypothetical protein
MRNVACSNVAVPLFANFHISPIISFGQKTHQDPNKSSSTFISTRYKRSPDCILIDYTFLTFPPFEEDQIVSTSDTLRSWERSLLSRPCEIHGINARRRSITLPSYVVASHAPARSGTPLAPQYSSLHAREHFDWFELIGPRLHTLYRRGGKWRE